MPLICYYCYYNYDEGADVSLFYIIDEEENCICAPWSGYWGGLAVGGKPLPGCQELLIRASYLHSLSSPIFPGNSWWHYYRAWARIFVWTDSCYYFWSFQGNFGYNSLPFVHDLADRSSQEYFWVGGCWPGECCFASAALVWYKNDVLLSLSWQVTLW